MPCARSGTVEKLKSLHSSSSLIPEIIAGFEQAYHRASDSETNSWQQHICFLRR